MALQRTPFENAQLREQEKREKIEQEKEHKAYVQERTKAGASDALAELMWKERCEFKERIALLHKTRREPVF